MLETETLALGEELLARDLAAPVSFRGLLQVTELTHTGETQNGSKSVSVNVPTVKQQGRE